jgi:uncharacterized membrane protein YqjE
MTLATSADESFAQRMRDRREELRELTREAGDIATGAGYIARAEVRLAVTEMRDGISATMRTGIWGGIALFIAAITLFWLPLPIFIVLAEILPWWIAATATVGLFALLATTLGLVAYRQLKGIQLVPREALQRMKEDQRWLRQQLSGKPG